MKTTVKQIDLHLTNSGDFVRFLQEEGFLKVLYINKNGVTVHEEQIDVDNPEDVFAMADMIVLDVGTDDNQVEEVRNKLVLVMSAFATDYNQQITLAIPAKHVQYRNPVMDRFYEEDPMSQSNHP